MQLRHFTPLYTSVEDVQTKQGCHEQFELCHRKKVVLGHQDCKQHGQLLAV